MSKWLKKLERCVSYELDIAINSYESQIDVIGIIMKYIGNDFEPKIGIEGMLVYIAIDNDDEFKSYDILPHKSIKQVITQVLRENNIESKFDINTCGIWSWVEKKYKIYGYANYKPPPEMEDQCYFDTYATGYSFLWLKHIKKHKLARDVLV